MIMSDFYFGFIGFFAKPWEPEFFVVPKLAQIWEFSVFWPFTIGISFINYYRKSSKYVWFFIVNYKGKVNSKWPNTLNSHILSREKKSKNSGASGVAQNLSKPK